MGMENITSPSCASLRKWIYDPKLKSYSVLLSRKGTEAASSVECRSESLARPRVTRGFEAANLAGGLQTFLTSKWVCFF